MKGTKQKTFQIPIMIIVKFKTPIDSHCEGAVTSSKIRFDDKGNIIILVAFTGNIIVMPASNLKSIDTV